MKKIFIVLFLTSILSCSKENKNEIPLFNELSFKIYDGESIVAVNTEIKDKYSKSFNSSIIQIPLLKYIKGTNYEIFIGVPYNVSIEAMIENQLSMQESVAVDFKSDSLFYFKSYKKNEFYIAEYAAKIDNESLLYISTMSDSKALTDSLFNEHELSKRIISTK
ncbi:MAG: hypothetical protein ACKVQV_05325 [Bacteroidia bacterium]